MYPQSMFWSKNKKNIKFLLMKFSIFTGEKNLCILHGQVFVMKTKFYLRFISYEVNNPFFDHIQVTVG